MDYTSKSFKLISPIERIRMMEVLKNTYGKEWISESDKVLKVKNNPDNNSLLKSRMVEIEVADKIINCFKSIITKYFKDTDYISKYELKSKYILEDSETSKKANERDEKISTFILNTIRDNMNELNIDNSYPLVGNNCFYTTNKDSNIQINFPDKLEDINKDLLPLLLVKPCENVGPDIIGILMLKSEFSNSPLPKCIPLIVAISQLESDEKHKQDYQTTNLENMYCEHVGTDECRIWTKLNEKQERARIEKAIQSITKSGKMLRIMVHPTVKPMDSVSAKDRIKMLSDGSDVVDETPSANAVILKNGNCVLELFHNDLNHCNE